MRDFIKAVDSPWVGVWLDAGIVLAFGYPEHWAFILGKQIIRPHLWNYRVAVGSVNCFMDLLAGDVNRIALMKALDAIEFDGWANGEMCPAYRQHTEQMICNCS